MIHNHVIALGVHVSFLVVAFGLCIRDLLVRRRSVFWACPYSYGRFRWIAVYWILLILCVIFR